MAEIKKIFVNGKDEVEFFKQLEKRSGETNKKVTAVVNEIIETVREGGDNAVKAYTEKFDGKLPEYYEVPRDVINDAQRQIRTLLTQCSTLLRTSQIFTKDRSHRAL